MLCFVRLLCATDRRFIHAERLSRSMSGRVRTVAV